MRTGAAAQHQGYFHEAACYSSPDELLAIAVPFLLGGVEAGEPTVVSLGERNAGLVRSALPAEVADHVSFLAGGDVYLRPAAAIHSYRKMLASYVAQGAGQIRIIGELPPAALGATWDWWARYESAINRAYDDFPLWSMCAYDTRSTPAPVLADVLLTHPNVATPAGEHRPNPAYVEPVQYLSRIRPPVPDPLQHTPPVVELLDPTPVQARRAVHETDPGHLRGDEVDELAVAVSEVVTNALRHGRTPVWFRVWTGTDRTVVTVSDGGDGPKDPFAGLLPATSDSPGGRGLWITYQTCNHVVGCRTPDGYTMRLTAGNPHHDA